MPDNTDEEPLDNQKNTPAEKPSEEIISVKDTDAIRPN